MINLPNSHTQQKKKKMKHDRNVDILLFAYEHCVCAKCKFTPWNMFIYGICVLNHMSESEIIIIRLSLHNDFLSMFPMFPIFPMFSLYDFAHVQPNCSSHSGVVFFFSFYIFLYCIRNLSWWKKTMCKWFRWWAVVSSSRLFLFYHFFHFSFSVFSFIKLLCGRYFARSLRVFVRYKMYFISFYSIFFCVHFLYVCV